MDKVRLSDIASELELSTATVSYVLHGKTCMVYLALTSVRQDTAARAKCALDAIKNSGPVFRWNRPLPFPRPLLFGTAQGTAVRR